MCSYNRICKRTDLLQKNLTISSTEGRSKIEIAKIEIINVRAECSTRSPSNSQGVAESILFIVNDAP